MHFADLYAREKNAATNGRLFCVGLFVANIAALFGGFGGAHLSLAVLALIPIGIAVIADRIPFGWTHTAVTIFCMIWAATVAGFTLARALL